MIFLYILLAIIALIALVLMLHLKLSVKYGEKTYVGVGILCFYYKLAPAKKKKTKRSSEKCTKKQTQSQPPAKKKNSILSEFTDGLEISDFIELLRLLMVRLVEHSSGHLKVRLKKLEVVVADKQPDCTAILFGTVNTATALLLEYLETNTKLYPLEKSSVYVRYDFDASKTKSVIELTTKIRIIHLLKFAVMFFLDFIKLKETKNYKSTPKGYAQNERK